MGSITGSFRIETKKLRHIQGLLGRYNGYFDGNPEIFYENALVYFEFNDVKKWNSFARMLNIVEQKYF